MDMDPLVIKLWGAADEDLIEFVRANPIIYNYKIKRLHGVRRKMAIKNLWNVYGKKTNRPAAEVAKRWKTIHDTYRRYLKNPEKLGATSKYLHPCLSFLGEFDLPPIESITDENMGALKVTTSCSPPVIKCTNVHLEASKVPLKQVASPSSHSTNLEELNTYLLQVPSPLSVTNLTDGDINVLQPKITKPSPAVNLSDGVIDEPAKNVYNKDKLFKTTVLTQDMIEKVLKFNSKKENDAQVYCQQMNTEQDDETNQETTMKMLETRTEMETNHTLDDVIESNNEILCPTAKTVVSEVHTENLHIKVANDDITAAQDSSSTNRAKLPNQQDKGVSNQLGNLTTELFIEMGTYVSDHFSKKKQIELRTMIWSLLQEELKLLHKK